MEGTCLVIFLRIRRDVLNGLALELDSLSDVDSVFELNADSLGELSSDGSSEFFQLALSLEPEGILVVSWTSPSSASL